MFKSLLMLTFLVGSANAFDLFTNDNPIIDKSWYKKNNNSLFIYISVVQGICGQLYKVDKNNTYKSRFLYYIYQDKETASKYEDKAVLCAKKIMSKYKLNELRYIALNNKSKENKEFNLYIKDLKKEADKFIQK